MDGGECGACRASHRDDAAFLAGTSRSGEYLEGLYRAAGQLSVGPRRPDHIDSSLNLLAPSSVIASSAASASGPATETMMVVPGAADNIISPMIEVPPTDSPPRVTQTSALKRSTI